MNVTQIHLFTSHSIRNVYLYIEIINSYATSLCIFPPSLPSHSENRTISHPFGEMRNEMNYQWDTFRLIFSLSLIFLHLFLLVKEFLFQRPFVAFTALYWMSSELAVFPIILCTYFSHRVASFPFLWIMNLKSITFSTNKHIPVHSYILYSTRTITTPNDTQK